MATTETINVEVLLRDPDFQKGVRRITKSTETAKKKTGNFLKQMKAGWIALAAAIAIVGRAILSFGRKSIQAASDFEEANAKFNTVFRGVTVEANKMRDGLVDSYAMSRLEATRFLSSIQDMLVPMGMARGEAASMGNEIVKLAADLGSFNNQPTAEVMRGIQSALAGQIEPMRQYGVFLTQARIQQEAMNMGLVEAGEELTTVAKAQATLSIITQDSSDAIGDMARTSDSWANSLKQIKAFADDVVVLIGQELVAAFQPAISSMREFTESADALERVRITIHKIVAAFRLLWQAVDFAVNVALTQMALLSDFFSQMFLNFSNIMDEFGLAWQALWSGNFTSMQDHLEIMNQTIFDVLVAPLKENIIDLKTEWDDLMAAWVSATEESMATIANTVDTTTKGIATIDTSYVTGKKAKIKDITKSVKAAMKDRRDAAQALNDALTAMDVARASGVLDNIGNTLGAISDMYVTDAKRQKRIAVAIAMIQGLGAVMKAINSAPFPYNLPAIVATTAQTAAQMIKINAVDVPSFQAGGVVGAGGPQLIQVGEAGRELVLPNNVTEALLAAVGGGATGGNTLNISPGAIQQTIPGGTPGAVQRETFQAIRDLGDEFGTGNLFRG